MTTTYEPAGTTPAPWPPARPSTQDPASGPADVGTERPHDPRWTRAALLALLVATAVLYLWNLSASGWANAYYSAAAQAGSQDWTAFLFGSSDAANLITVDKPPASLWVMALSVRVFGLSSWALLVPQALMGVAAVGLLYATVRRWAGAVAGLLAGLVLAITPVATLMFRFNNPDALLVLLLVAAAYALVRAIDTGSLRWVAGAGVLLGFAFLTKSLQAFLVLPAFALVWAAAARTSLGRRVVGLVVGGAAMALAGGWWVALVELWPADSRPYIGGSQADSALELILGYNGLGRLTGDEAGSVLPGGLAPQAGMWGETGLTRLFSAEYGGQAGWLLPAALILLLATVVLAGRSARTDRLRAAALLWGGWLVVTGLVISLSQGIIHPYYTVALAPAIAALVGTGAVALWSRRGSWPARVTLGATMAVTSAWAAILLGRSPDWLPWLRWLVLAGGVVTAIALLAVDRLPRPAATGVAVGALAVALAGPLAYSIQTALTPHSGSLPSAGPSVAGARGGPGGAPGMAAGMGPGMAPGGTGGAPGMAPGGAPGMAPGGARGVPPGRPGGTPGAGGMGGLLDATTPSTELTDLLLRDSEAFTWAAAAVGAQSAAGLQLATGVPVMSLGGFNGSDPYPTLERFQQYVAEGEVHWFVSGGSGGPGGPGASSGTTAQITAWVEETFTAQTVDGATVYDLTEPAGTGSATASGSTAPA